MRVMMRFLGGEGLDEAELQRALELDVDPLDIPLAVRPRVLNALLHSGPIGSTRRPTRWPRSRSDRSSVARRAS